MSNDISIVAQPISLIERFQALRERCAAPVLSQVEHARTDLDARMIAHIHYRATELVDAILGA